MSSARTLAVRPAHAGSPARPAVNPVVFLEGKFRELLAQVQVGVRRSQPGIWGARYAHPLMRHSESAMGGLPRRFVLLS